MKDRAQSYLGYSQELGFPHYYALAWRSGNDWWLRPFIYGLKGGGPREVFEQVARFIVLKRLGGRLPQRVRIIHVPGHQEADHSFCLSREVAKILGVEVESCLLPSQSSPQGLQQKSKKISERQKVMFHKKPGYKTDHGESVILIDDVVTTGATAKAVFKALGAPPGFEVWSLVKRMKKDIPQPRRGVSF